MKTICLRFDVDSHRCIDEGVPALIELLATHDVPASFFVNMGRLTSRPRMVRHEVDRRRGVQESGPAKETLPLVRKLGRDGMIRVMATNPRVGAHSPERIAQLLLADHEVGLHGGRSHRLWQDDAPEWSRRRIRKEIAWGLGQLREVNEKQPRGFSSPGWARSDLVDREVRNHGFSYIVDDHGHGRAEVVVRDGLVRIPTNLAGEPGGVGYLEWLRARGMDDDAIEADFTERLDAAGDLAVMYDHPFYAGVSEVPMLSRLIGAAKERGWKFATMGEVAGRVRG